MSGAEGGWLWLMIDVVFVVIFALAVAYGLDLAQTPQRGRGAAARRSD